MTGPVEILDLADIEEPVGPVKPDKEFASLDWASAKTKEPKSKYVDLVRSTAREFGIPENFAIAQVHTESRYKPKAESQVGARGLFQFMPATARAEGLKVDDKVDERTDPAKAAKAYGRHITRLKNQFQKQFAKQNDLQRED